MLIHLDRDYRGAKTNEVPIMAGDYEIDEPALLGLGQYLLDNRHATIVEGDEPKAVVDEPVKPSGGHTPLAKQQGRPRKS